MQALEYKDSVLVAGSLDDLITILVPTETHQPERTYMFAFLLCSRLFIKPYELLSRVTRVRGRDITTCNTKVRYVKIIKLSVTAWKITVIRLAVNMAHRQKGLFIDRM